MPDSAPPCPEIARPETPRPPAYAELQALSNFSFLEGASHPEELVAQAAELGLAALALVDRNSLAGVVRAHRAAKAARLPFHVGARIDLIDGRSLLALPTDRAAYGRLSRLLTLGRRRAPKGQCHLQLADLLEAGEGQVLIALAVERSDRDRQNNLVATAELAAALKSAFPDHAYLAASHRLDGRDRSRIEALADLARRIDLPLVTTNDVLYHRPERRPLQDALTCIREGCRIERAGLRLQANAERHLKSPKEVAQLFRLWPQALAHSLEISARCRFSLDELRYDYPEEVVAPGETAQQTLERLTWAGAKERYPAGPPDKVAAALAHELALIARLGYAPYFLTVHDLVRYAREREILCQGRGSAANSAVCFCLGITAVDPAKHDLLFERFVSAARNEPPDIDVDFEHERREEVIQYIYRKYGRERAGLAATVICYRPRSALRDIGKAMGLSLDTVEALSRQVWGWSDKALDETKLRGAGLDPTAPALAATLDLARQLIGFPRHLSQHVGGFVISRAPLSELVPIENAAMADRTVIQWDKDDLDAVGLMKVDVLALGMLSCIAKAFKLIERYYGRKLDLASLPPEDPAVYDMLCRADSLGVFQVESRAQMTMLPRLKPRNFYDLVIEVAIVRPGPIQGDMVHPFLRRRNGEEKVSFPSRELEEVLGKTLGVPLFQEQAMKIAIVAAGFTPEEADGLRRAMATFRKNGTIHHFERKMIDGMVARGYEPDFATRCFRQIEGFGDYGFPESHAASFALLVYVSAWLKRHYPAVFACALLNSQPMGFYAPAQIVRDAAEHGVRLLPVDVNRSDWDNMLELDPTSGGDGWALRLGLRQAKGVGPEAAEALVARRGNGYRDVAALWRRAEIDAKNLAALARADAFGSLGLDRRAALWAIQGLADRPTPLFAGQGVEEQGAEEEVTLPAMTLGAEVTEDYRHLRLSLKAHPLALLRPEMAARDFRRCATLAETPDGTRLGVAGLVLVRQRPGTASGVIFATLEDETGIANIVIWSRIFERYRPTVLTAKLLGVHGKLQREGLVIHLVAERLVDLTPSLAGLDRLDAAGLAKDVPPPIATSSAAALEPPWAYADEVRKPGRDPRLAAAQFRSRDFH